MADFIKTNLRHHKMTLSDTPSFQDWLHGRTSPEFELVSSISYGDLHYAERDFLHCISNLISQQVLYNMIINKYILFFIYSTAWWLIWDHWFHAVFIRQSPGKNQLSDDCRVKTAWNQWSQISTDTIIYIYIYIYIYMCVCVCVCVCEWTVT